MIKVFLIEIAYLFTYQSPNSPKREQIGTKLAKGERKNK